jgi:transcriptional regulator with XRE-family HTH domain
VPQPQNAKGLSTSLRVSTAVIARLLHVSRPTARRLLNGTYPPTSEEAATVAAYFGIAEDQLWRPERWPRPRRARRAKTPVPLGRGSGRRGCGGGTFGTLATPRPGPFTQRELHTRKDTAMSDDNIVHQWAPRKGFERRTLPSTSESWSPTQSVVARFLLHLKALGLKDPTGATDLYRTAVSLREHTVAVTAKPNEEVAIAERLARGEVTPTEAAKLLAKAPKPSDAIDQAEREAHMLRAATRHAFAASVRAVHDFGDRWLQLLRPLVEEAVAAKDDARFAALHDFAALLRDRDLGALAMVASDQSGTREFGETWRHLVGRPERYHMWRIERAEIAQPIFHEVVGPLTFVAGSVEKGPRPSLAEMVAGEMEPGIFSAQEVLAIAGRIVIEQEEARMSATPPPSPARRVVVI